MLLLGVWQWEKWRVGRWRFVLPCVVAANYVLPASHVMWNQKIDIRTMPVEIYALRDPPTLFAAARLLLESDELIAAGRLAEVSAKLDEAIDLDPRYANAFVKRAALRMSEGNYAAAEPDLNEALEIDADSATGNFLLGVILGSQRRWQDAVNHLQHALDHAPPDWPARQDAERFLRETNAALHQP